MNLTVYLALILATCLCIAEGAPEGRMTRKQQRPTRGFKNVEMMTARGFGKRARTELYNGMENFWENLEATQEKDGQDTEEKTVQSIPLDWFVNEMINNPDFARSVVRKFIDLNQDGMLSSDELLRNV